MPRVEGNNQSASCDCFLINSLITSSAQSQIMDVLQITSLIEGGKHTSEWQSLIE